MWGLISFFSTKVKALVKAYEIVLWPYKDFFLKCNMDTLIFQFPIYLETRYQVTIDPWFQISYRELEDEGYRFQVQPPEKNPWDFPGCFFTITNQKCGEIQNPPGSIINLPTVSVGWLDLCWIRCVWICKQNHGRRRCLVMGGGRNPLLVVSWLWVDMLGGLMCWGGWGVGGVCFFFWDLVLRCWEKNMREISTEGCFLTEGMAISMELSLAVKTLPETKSPDAWWFWKRN